MKKLPRGFVRGPERLKQVPTPTPTLVWTTQKSLKLALREKRTEAKDIFDTTKPLLKLTDDSKTNYMPTDRCRLLATHQAATFLDIRNETGRFYEPPSVDVFTFPFSNAFSSRRVFVPGYARNARPLLPPILNLSG